MRDLEDLARTYRRLGDEVRSGGLSRRGFLRLAAGAGVGILAGCTEGGDDLPTGPGPSEGETARISFYDGAKTTYNRSGQSWGGTHRVPIENVTAEFTNSKGERVVGSSGSNFLDVLKSANSRIRLMDNDGYFDYEFKLGDLRDEYQQVPGDNSAFFFFLVPKDDPELLELLTYVEEAGLFRGWGPGADIFYRDRDGNQAMLERHAQSFYQQLGHVDVNPRHGNQIIGSDPNATAGSPSNPTGVVAMRDNGWGFGGRGPVLKGGPLDYLSRDPNRVRLVPHELGRSLGQIGNAPVGLSRLFSAGGSETVTDVEGDALRLGINLAGYPAPDGSL